MMKKFAIAAGLALMVGASAAQAHGEHPGFALSPNGMPVMTKAGECVMTKSMLSETVAPCHGEKMMKEEEAPKAMSMAEEKTFALYFDFDSTVVGRVNNIVDYISGLAMLKSVELVGHADPIGDAAYNFGLSQRRAEAVAATLVDSGVDGSKINVSAMGENAPVANCTGTGAQLIACLRPDRRVDVKIMGDKKAM